MKEVTKKQDNLIPPFRCGADFDHLNNFNFFFYINVLDDTFSVKNIFHKYEKKIFILCLFVIFRFISFTCFD